MDAVFQEIQNLEALCRWVVVGEILMFLSIAFLTVVVVFLNIVAMISIISGFFFIKMDMGRMKGSIDHSKLTQEAQSGFLREVMEDFKSSLGKMTDSLQQISNEQKTMRSDLSLHMAADSTTLRDIRDSLTALAQKKR